jgi:hypothetical protein
MRVVVCLMSLVATAEAFAPSHNFNTKYYQKANPGVALEMANGDRRRAALKVRTFLTLSVVVVGVFLFASSLSCFHKLFNKTSSHTHVTALTVDGW